MSLTDALPTLLGLALVAAAAAFALVPLGRPARTESNAWSETAATDRFLLYRQLLELELDHQLGKLSTADYALQSNELMAVAGQLLRHERGQMDELDAEIEREIAAARAAFAAARTTSSPTVGSPT